MDKAEIIKELEAFPYSREDYWVLTGSAMALYGIKEQTSDIDLCSGREHEPLKIIDKE